MIAALALGVALTGSTYSWENAAGHTLYYYNHVPADLGPPVAGVVDTASAAAATSAASTGCNCTAKIFPDELPVDIVDWDTTPIMPVGVEVEGMQRVVWPGQASDRAALAHLQATFEGIAGAFADLGVQLEVRHLHFLDHDVALEGATAQMRADWSELPAVRYVIRLSPTMGSNKSDIRNLCEYTPSAFGIGRAFYHWSITPESDPTAWQWQLHTLAHEISHGILAMQHSQCYRRADASPVEACWDGACWTGATTCPAAADISYMGNCGCYWPKPLQLGPTRGELASIARSHVLAHSECLENAGGCQIQQPCVERGFPWRALIFSALAGVIFWRVLR